MRRLVPFALGFVMVARAVVVVRTDGPATPGPARPPHWVPRLVTGSTTTTTAPPVPHPTPGPVVPLAPVTGPANVYPL